MIRTVPLSAPWINQDDIDAVMAVLQTSQLSIGPQVKAFEKAVAERVGVKHALAVNSGTSGLHLCLEALGIGEGDEVITSSFSFVASANCIIYTGATPVFVDIEPETLAIDPAKIEAAITEKTKAIIPIDVFGQPCRIEEISAIARKHNLALVQDSCEAIGAVRNGKEVGGPEYCDAAVFAFYPNKQMTTGEGGIVVTDNDELARAIDSMRNQGRDDAGTWMNHVRVGYNYRLDEMSAALGLSQVSRLDAILDHRENVARMYSERLADVPGVTVPNVLPETTRMSWFVYVIQLDEGIDKTDVIAQLDARGVPRRPYFSPIHLQPIYREMYGYQGGEFPVTEAVAQRTLAIPFYSLMPEDEVDYVCEQIREVVPTKF